MEEQKRFFIGLDKLENLQKNLVYTHGVEVQRTFKLDEDLCDQRTYQVVLWLIVIIERLADYVSVSTDICDGDRTIISFLQKG